MNEVMGDRELCEMFGSTLEDVERDVSKIEAGDFSGFDFSRVMTGRPTAEGKAGETEVYSDGCPSVES